MSSLHEFLDKLSFFFEHCDTSWPYGIELRNPNYLREPYFDFLTQYNLSHVYLQGYYMPFIGETHRQFGRNLRHPCAIRLHGPDRSDIEEKSKGIWNSILEPKEDEISRITKIIEDIHSRNLDVYVNVNNHYEGSAPLTIERIRERMNL